MIMVTKVSMLTGKLGSLLLDVTIEQLLLHRSGALAQNVFPNLDDAEREFLITGITPSEWDAQNFTQIED